MFAEYVGLEQDVASQIEARRENPTETKSDILRRLLGVRSEPDIVANPNQLIDFKQGIRLPVGERLYLFLFKPNGVDQKPDGMAEVKVDGLYLEGVKVPPSKGSALAPAMHHIQVRLNHVDDNGKPVSLSAYQKWYVVRDEKLVQLDQLKDPQLRRRRKPKVSTVDVKALLAELGLE